MKHLEKYQKLIEISEKTQCYTHLEKLLRTILNYVKIL